ncbi:MAG: hypothetical protein Q4E02_03360 [Lagierella massiliensis]|nr:hypothetical protein [Lagierella massiliensis]
MLFKSQGISISTKDYNENYIRYGNDYAIALDRASPLIKQEYLNLTCNKFVESMRDNLENKIVD